MEPTLSSVINGVNGAAIKMRAGEGAWQFFKLLVASFCLGFGICLFVECGLGSDPIDVLLDGTNRTFGITLGQANLILNIFVFAIGMLVNRTAIGLSSVIGAILGSLMVDLVNPLVMSIDLIGQALAWRVLALLIGQVGLCCCYGIMQTIPHGSNISDAFVLWIASVAPGAYAFWRMAYDALCFAVGVLWGGVFGVGTVMSVLTTGICTRWIAAGGRGLDGIVLKRA